MLLISLFIIIFNIVAIALVYYCLDNMEKKDKLIFIGVGIAAIYILTSLVYWISTHDIEIKEVSEMGKTLITLLFVPVNGIITLPLLAKSYRKYSIGNLKADKFRNRVIVLIGILIILLLVECAYFKDIQNSVVRMIENNPKVQSEKNVTLNKNDIDPNLDLNLIAEDGITYNNEENMISGNEMIENNIDINTEYQNVMETNLLGE